ncbi:MAG: Cof-type HAD-IIB family hydrolase [Bacillus sp. (in: Bacteria)]|nr:Cof-type HAD-IIB family hydrolase [Bacillus sp. (in: firmicutes)]MCM1427642.1 Cof-type HAD-IIB family hydrolase [Eubacterium sp.]
MAVKCIALDLDRTTLNKEGRLSKQNREALEKVIASGIHVMIASGRALDTLPQDMLLLPGIEYAITGNGAAMYHLPTGKCLKRYQLSERAIEAVMRVTKDEDVTYEAFIDGIAYADKRYLAEPLRFGATPQTLTYVRATRHMQDDIVKFIEEHKHHMDSMDIIVKGEEMKKRVWRKVQEATDEVYITSSIQHLVEIADKNAGKGAGLVFVTELLGINREETAAFGDADNDVDMLRYAGCGIAMENASETCKAAADFITKHHDEDGIAYALQHILKLI